MPTTVPEIVSAHRSIHSPYPLRLAVFEGPLDLLLHLIRTHKLDIRDIPIARITEQYLEYLALMAALDLNVASDFLVMAATLMELKSRMLLPRPAPIQDSEEAGDPRAELVARLLEYERFQQVAEELRELAAETHRSFARPLADEWSGAIPLVELTPRDLLEALRAMTRGSESENSNGHAATPSLRVRRHAVNLRQRAAEILRRVQSHGEALPFHLLVLRGGRRMSRSEVLVTFLAILELVRQGLVSAWQHGICGEILLLPLTPAPEPEGSPASS